MKRIFYLLFVSLIIGGAWYVKSDDLFASEDLFNDSMDPFSKESRDFSVIDKTTDENKCKDIVFKSMWKDSEYSVYIWKHEGPKYMYEIKSYFSSDVSNFISVLNAVGYNITNVYRRTDGREHVIFCCKDFANKLEKDVIHMLYIQ